MSFKGELREYQEVAKGLITERGKALLALDLGTGKTVVSIAAIEELREAGKIKCALLIMSSSLTKQWEERIAQFTDSTAIVVDGSISPKKRSDILKNAIHNPPDYLVVGIRQVVSDLTFIQKIKPDLVLVDEVTCIKNFATQQTKTIKKLKTSYRVGLTAEPIENGKAEELFSIMQWIDDSVFGHWQEFDSRYIERNKYNMVVGYNNMDELNQKLMTACVSKRREDPDVSSFMPTVEEYNVYVEMDDETRVVYRGIARELLQALYSAGPRDYIDIERAYGERNGKSSSDGSHELGPITSRLLALHLLLDDPSVLEASARAYDDPTTDGGSKYANGLWKAGKLPSTGFQGAKLETCLELVHEYMEKPEHKVIIFARFKSILYTLAEELKEYGPVLFTGDLNGEQRGAAISAFTNNDGVRLFLSSDAGGYGVDLFRASHLINYDLPQSSGTFKQRNGRHVRASSTFRTVFIDNLIVADSVEEYQLARLNYKAKVSHAALTGMSDSDGRVANDAKSLTRHLEIYLGEK